jgi:ATP-binding cassette subfamily B protein
MMRFERMKSSMFRTATMPESTSILKQKLRNALGQLPWLPRGLALAWEASRPWTIAWLLLLVVQGLIPVGIVYLTKVVVDALVAALKSGPAWPNVRGVLVSIILLAAITVLSEVVRAAIGWIREVQAELMKDHINGLIQTKSVAADLAFYEFPDYYDHLHRARAEASFRPVALLESLGGLLQNGITLLAMGAILIPLGPWLSVALLVSTLPAFFVVLRYALVQYQWRLRTTSDERRATYYDWLLTAGESAAEVRLFGLGSHFQSVYQGLRRRLRNERFQMARRQSVAELSASVIALLISGGALTWVAWRAMHGLVTLGDLALIYAALNQGQRLMRSLIENVGQLYANSLFLGNLFEFLALEPLITEPSAARAKLPHDLNDQLSFEHISFRYPESSRKALDDFNLTVPAGQIVAIVGPNGAGKSTLIKLLCRFYDPEDGRIELDNTDLKEIPTQHLRRLITVLFQQPVHYNVTVKENIEFGDLEHEPEMREVEAAVAAAGAEGIVSRLPNGYHSLLGRWFSGGTELSVGEWQRIALARAFLRRAPIIILDEPTSALDPWAEADWLQRFRRLAAGRTAIIITHRFTTAMHADVIHVLEEGHIVESGSHYQLLQRNGRYADSWARQTTAAGDNLVPANP